MSFFRLLHTYNEFPYHVQTQHLVYRLKDNEFRKQGFICVTHTQIAYANVGLLSFMMFGPNLISNTRKVYMMFKMLERMILLWML